MVRALKVVLVAEDGSMMWALTLGPSGSTTHMVPVLSDHIPTGLLSNAERSGIW